MGFVFNYIGGHINPAVTFGLFLARKVSLIRAVAYMVAQCLGAICGVGLVKAFMKHDYDTQGGGANLVSHGYNKGTALGAEIIGTFVLVYTVFSATDPKRSARDSHVPVCNTFILCYILICSNLLLCFCHGGVSNFLLIICLCLCVCRCWRHFLLGLLCSLCTWPRSPSLVLVLTQLGVLVLL